VPYQFLHWLKASAPEARYYQAEWATASARAGLDDVENPMIAVCTGSHWSDMLVYALARLMDDPGVDGVYMDGAVGYQCSNAAHGHGWRDDNGQWRTQ